VGEQISEYNIHQDSGHFIIDSHKLETDHEAHEVFTIAADDPLSAEADMLFSIRIGRGDWQTRTVTRTIMRSTKEDFILAATLDAYEGTGDDERRVFSKNYHRTVKRDFN
jgi:hypothetical protein